MTWCFHLSLNVADLGRAVGFYRTLFGSEPAKCHDDYAKFEVLDPPVVFSLVPHSVGPSGLRSRIGLRLTSDEQLHLLRSRLIAQNVVVKSSTCGKSNYTFEDPDGNSWQISVGAHLADDAMQNARTTSAASVEAKTAPTVWEHYITSDLPNRIPHDGGSMDEIRLTGSFNGPQKDDARKQLVTEAFRALKPGGKIVVHALAADRPLAALPQLPGPAAMVSHVPCQLDVIAVLTDAGFIGVQITKFDAKAWFEHDGVGMREVKFLAWKPTAAAEATGSHVIYRGPFKEVRADDGSIFPRGERVAVAPGTWQMLRESPLASSFVFVETKPGQACQTAAHSSESKRAAEAV